MKYLVIIVLVIVAKVSIAQTLYMDSVFYEVNKTTYNYDTCKNEILKFDYYVAEGSSDAPIKTKEFEKLNEIDKGRYIPMKDVFRTFKEINQMELVKQAGVRQQYIDQSASLNLAFPTEAEPKFINQVHLEAYKQGIKTLYYMRTESVLRGDIAARATDDCLSCDG